MQMRYYDLRGTLTGGGERSVMYPGIQEILDIARGEVTSTCRDRERPFPVS